MSDVIRNSPTLQKLVDDNGITKKNILESALENPQIVSTEYADGLLTIVTTIDSAPIIIAVDLKD